MVKKTPVDEYRITNRGGKGVKTINVTEKTGALVGMLMVDETDDLIITCKSGITIRTGIADIREAGRATQGVKLINLNDGDEIAAITKIVKLEEALIKTETDVSISPIITDMELPLNGNDLHQNGTESVDKSSN